jgi:hypothetical protein
MLKAYPPRSVQRRPRAARIVDATDGRVIVANLERAGSIIRRSHSVHGRVLTIALSEIDLGETASAK